MLVKMQRNWITQHSVEQNVLWQSHSRRQFGGFLKMKYATQQLCTARHLSKRKKTYVYTKTSTQMFTAVLFVTEKSGNNTGVLQGGND